MPAKIYHFDLYGKREEKYEFLRNNSVSTTPWVELQPDSKYHFFVPKNFDEQVEWEEGVKVSELFQVWSSAVQTKRDSLYTDFDLKELEKRIHLLFSGEYSSNFISDFNIQNSSSYNFSERLKKANYHQNCLKKYNYKPFEIKNIYYDENLLGRPFYNVMKHFILGENTGLNLMKTQVDSNNFSTVLITNSLSDINFYGFQTYTFPLYLYSDVEKDEGGIFDETTPKPSVSPLERGTLGLSRPNFKSEIIAQIEAKLGMKLDWEAPLRVSLHPVKTSLNNDLPNGELKFSATDLLDYIYAVLHSPSYRSKYKEFLKIDFPRIPFDVSVERFWDMILIGSKLRKLHLMDDIGMHKITVGYPQSGDNIVRSVRFEEGFTAAPITESSQDGNTGKVWINDTQYFENISKTSWDFYIGGYQPAQKWLKDRKGRELSFDDIIHYQRLIFVLDQTDKITNHIDKI